MTGHTDHTHRRDPLNWLAVQYVLGELSESEAFAFEELLATDLAACEAVAEATRLTLTLHAATGSQSVPALVADSFHASPSTTNHSSKTTPRGSWLALAGATTAAAVLLAAMSLGPASSPSTQLALVDRSASELVSLWRAGSAAAELDFDDADVELAESRLEVAVPDWLFAAVSLEQPNPAANLTEDRQEN